MEKHVKAKQSYAVPYHNQRNFVLIEGRQSDTNISVIAMELDYVSDSQNDLLFAKLVVTLLVIW